MIHLKNSGYLPKDAPKLLSQASELTSDMDCIVRDMRVSSRYLEFDVSIPKELLDVFVEKLVNIGQLVHARHLIDEEITKEDAIEKGRYYFNYERFWECHEILEGVWKKSHEGEKDLLQGIILVAAGFVHYQKNENEICLSIFKRAVEKIGNGMGKYYKIDVDAFRNKVLDMISSKKISTFMI